MRHGHARLVLLAAVAWLASCASEPQRHTPPPPVEVAPPPPAPVVINPGGITFAAVGDVMMGTDYPDNVLPDDDGVSFLASVTPVLSAADIAFGNLEGVLMDGGEAIKRCRPAVKAKGISKKEVPVTTVPAVAPVPATAPPAPVVAPVPATVPGPSPAQAPAAAPASAQNPFSVERDDRPIDAVPVEESATAERSEQVARPDAASTSGADGPTDAPSSTTPPAPAAPATPVATPPPASASTTDAATNPPPTGGSCFVFRSPTRYATYLQQAGFDVMSLANNHAQDFGDPGRDSSMRTLDQVGIHHSGRDGDVAEWTTKGRKFALVAFAPNVGSHQLNDLVRAQDLVTQLAAKHDIVIVSFHGGAEGDGASKLTFARENYAGEDRGDVVEFAHTVIDAGADLVIGHGPHVMRPIELYRDRLIAYSLGNFATYYGISVNGIRGTSGILATRLADDGRFMEARFTPTVQIRPGGPQPDPQQRALNQLRDLTTEAFPQGALVIENDGRIERKSPSPAATATATPQ